MRKAVRWIGLGLGSVIGLLLLVGVALYTWTTVRLNRTYSFQPEAVIAPVAPRASSAAGTGFR